METLKCDGTADEECKHMDNNNNNPLTLLGSWKPLSATLGFSGFCPGFRGDAISYYLASVTSGSYPWLFDILKSECAARVPVAGFHELLSVSTIGSNCPSGIRAHTRMKPLKLPKIIYARAICSNLLEPACSESDFTLEGVTG
ncbi:hypothetical protein PAAG_06436 [Paracoccidioides lutzii Pb01]|uniref:Uncharacterized protein n=1 Tax=Paracoccidioides lutzii (strain ATCC MYA-826 / Pb01) TaxID=502779 RepID=C1H6P5_PARBA|nr:hypothetical protein PAAG_06436 [Paracoccidioides lutzii Pb01]EEH35389.2 hypothetical protein PAAG_06436 [Paracoccidioides lutzii Pb01]